MHPVAVNSYGPVTRLLSSELLTSEVIFAFLTLYYVEAGVHSPGG